MVRKGATGERRDGRPDKRSDERWDKRSDDKLSEFYDWLSRFVVEHPDEWSALDERERCALDAWCFAHYVGGLNSRVGNGLSVPPTEDETISLDVMVDELLADERQLYVLPCDCRLLHDGEAAEVCLTYHITPETEAEHPYARRISGEEGADIARAADKAGLIHTRNVTGYCNCDVRWCYLFRARTVRTGEVTAPDPSGWLTGEGIIDHDTERCTRCLRCVKRCQFGVFVAGSDKDAGLDVLTQKCIGCGLCVTTCPANALQLVKR